MPGQVKWDLPARCATPSQTQCIDVEIGKAGNLPLYAERFGRPAPGWALLSDVRDWSEPAEVETSAVPVIGLPDSSTTRVSSSWSSKSLIEIRPPLV